MTGFLLGGAYAMHDVLGRDFVREFQAGDGSDTAERWLAIAQQTAIEGVGFGLLGLLVAIVSLVLARLRGGMAKADGEPSPGALRASSTLLVAAAFVGWLNVSHLAEDVFPFLQPGPLLLLNACGFLLALVCLALWDGIVGLLPWARGAQAGARALASSVAALVVLDRGLWIVKGGRGPLQLAMAAGCLVAGLLAAAFLARFLDRPFRRLGERLARGPLVPGFAKGIAGLALGICIGVSAPSFQLSSVPPSVDYGSLPGREPRSDGPRVVWITIDTLRADHLGCYGYERPTSPTLDAIAEDGTLFLDPSAPAAWTKPSTGTILTGLYPSRHGALYHGSILQLPEGERTLAEAFQDSGYVTAGFVSNPNIKRVFEFDRGFDEFFDSPVEDTVTLASIRGSHFGQILMRLMRHQFNWKYENDVRQMNRHILAWLEENREEPFFLYLHYIDPHIPYSPPSPYLEDFQQDHGFVVLNERKELVGRDLYDGEIRYLDDGIADLVAKLEELGMWDDTIVVVTSDHGEEFFEHGVLGHGFSLYQPVVGVPVFVRGPGVAKGRRVSDPVQVLDLPATVLDLAGTGITRLGDGFSFAAAARDGEQDELRPIYLENEFGTGAHDDRAFVFKGVRSGPWKLVVTEENAYFPPQAYGKMALYNLHDDPEEKVNLFEDERYGDVIARLFEGLQEHSKHLEETGFRDAAPAELDPALEAQLRHLGYMDGVGDDDD